jgi:hypothetical protein
MDANVQKRKFRTTHTWGDSWEARTSPAHRTAIAVRIRGIGNHAHRRERRSPPLGPDFEFWSTICPPEEFPDTEASFCRLARLTEVYCEHGTSDSARHK